MDSAVPVIIGGGGGDKQQLLFRACCLFTCSLLDVNSAFPQGRTGIASPILTFENIHGPF